MLPHSSFFSYWLHDLDVLEISQHIFSWIFQEICVVGYFYFKQFLLCHQHLCCVAYRDGLVIQLCGVGVICRCHTLYSGQYLKNGLADLIQMWHVDVTAPGGVLYIVL